MALDISLRAMSPWTAKSGSMNAESLGSIHEGCGGAGVFLIRGGEARRLSHVVWVSSTKALRPLIDAEFDFRQVKRKVELK